MELIGSFLNTLFLIIVLASLIKLFSVASVLQRRERYVMPSELIDKVESGEDPETLAADADETSKREKIALETVEKEIEEQEQIDEVDADVQADEIEAAEDAFYGMARHARSGNLIDVKMQPEQGGSKISDDDGWVNRTTEGGKKAIRYEDLESVDDAFSRNYALWKCYKTAGCKGAIYARDGSKFALYSNFNGADGKKQPIVSITDPGRAGKKGKGKFTTIKGTVSTDIDLQPKTKKSAEEGMDGGDYDIHILDSPERLAAEKEAANMKETESRWKDKGSQALSEAQAYCKSHNPSTDWSRFSCVITGCSKKKNDNNKKKTKCSSAPRSLM